MGVDEEKGGWTPIERPKTRKVYDIQNQITANERDYWWRLTHRVIQTKKRESK